MKKIFALLFALLLTAFVYGQEPSVTGKISDIQGKKKVYLTAENAESKKKIQKILEKDKSFEIVGDAAQADFVLEYQLLVKNVQQSPLNPGDNENIASLSAYFVNADKKKVVAWSKANAASVKKSDGEKANEVSLANDFLKSYREPAEKKVTSEIKFSGAAQATLPNDDVQTLSGGIINGKAVKLEKPAYPAGARKDRASGVINVEVVIDTDGKILTATAVSDGHPALKAAAEEAARKSRFSPTTLNGEKVRIRGILVYSFMAQ